MGLFGLPVTDAARRLNDDFKLGLAFDREPTAEERKAARERMEAVEAHKRFEAWRSGFIYRLNEVYRRGHVSLKEGAPDAAAVRGMATAEYLSDALSFGAPEEQAQLYRERGKIETWINGILTD